MGSKALVAHSYGRGKWLRNPCPLAQKPVRNGLRSGPLLSGNPCRMARVLLCRTPFPKRKPMCQGVITGPNRRRPGILLFGRVIVGGPFLRILSVYGPVAWNINQRDTCTAVL